MSCRVVFTDAARQDLNEVADFVADHRSARQALYVVGEIRTRVESLRDFPARGARLPELADIGAGGGMDYRQIYWKPYRIVYFVAGKSVNILLIADGRRDLASLLMSRLLSPCVRQSRF